MNSEPDYLKLIFKNIPEPRILLHTNLPFLSIIMYNKAFEDAVLFQQDDLTGVPFSSVFGLKETDTDFLVLLPFFELAIREDKIQIIALNNKLLQNDNPAAL